MVRRFRSDKLAQLGGSKKKKKSKGWLRFQNIPLLKNLPSVKRAVLREIDFNKLREEIQQTREAMEKPSKNIPWERGEIEPIRKLPKTKQRIPSPKSNIRIRPMVEVMDWGKNKIKRKKQPKVDREIMWEEEEKYTQQPHENVLKSREKLNKILSKPKVGDKYQVAVAKRAGELGIVPKKLHELIERRLETIFIHQGERITKTSVMAEVKNALKESMGAFGKTGFSKRKKPKVVAEEIFTVPIEEEIELTPLKKKPKVVSKDGIPIWESEPINKKKVNDIPTMQKLTLEDIKAESRKKKSMAFSPKEMNELEILHHKHAIKKGNLSPSDQIKYDDLLRKVRKLPPKDKKLIHNGLKHLVKRI